MDQHWYFWCISKSGGFTKLSSSDENLQAELARRHKAAAATVIGLLIATVLMAVIGYLSRGYFTHQPNPSINIASRITMLVLGLGAVAWRRTKFSTLRLQDIGSLQGASGLLRTLERTTLQLSIMAAAAVVIGFIATVLTGDEFFTYTACGVGLLVLLYSYPIKSAWVKTVKRFAEQPNNPPPPSF